MRLVTEKIIFRIKSYWAEESDRFATKERTEELSAELDQFKGQLIDAQDMNRAQLKEMENEYQFLEESLEKKLENETQLTKKYVDGRIDAFQKHGISGTAFDFSVNDFKVVSEINSLQTFFLV